MPPIPTELMGDLWPLALPGAEGADYGTVSLNPLGQFPVRSLQTFTLTYTVGEFGLDDTGAIKIVQRWTNDGGALQTSDPTAINFVTATASNGVTLDVVAETYPHQRPWYNGLRVTVRRGFMRQGDTITVVYGDRSHGSPGLQLQSFCESAFEFKTLADACATGVFIPVASPHIEIVAGLPESWVLTAPTLRRPGEEFFLGIRAEDHWGNATGDYEGDLIVTADKPVEGLPARLAFPTGQRGVTIPGLIATDGPVRFELSTTGGTKLAKSNPMVVQSGQLASYWGDLHGQSGETVGINPMREYLEFARDVAHLDVTSHQANDFHLTNAFWRHINELTAAFNEDGRFTVFPGYEWSANTPLGGDHNVFFRNEGRQIVRSSHALLEDRSDLETGAHDLSDLFTSLEKEDVILFAHVGGRPADITRAEDARLRTAVEVHSDWGTFEWILTDAFENGYRVGLVCNSDGHKGAPGACYPGASEFGAYSGLTCFLAPELTRDAVFSCLRSRHHYGTTGARMHLDVSIDLGVDGAVYPVDPRVSEAPPVAQRYAIMGDIAKASGESASVRVEVHATSPILQIDVLNGAQVVSTHRPYTATELGNRVRVTWQGAEYRGRGRQTHWTGKIHVEDAKITRFERFNHWNHDRVFEQTGESEVTYNVVTTGNFVGCDLWLTDEAARIKVQSDLAFIETSLSDIPLEGTRTDCDGLDRNITLTRLPEQLDTRHMLVEVPVALTQYCDDPIWVRVKTDDGHTAWSSPVYVIPN